MTSQLVVDAVEQSNWTRKRDGKDLNGLTAHYDHRSQYLSVANTEHLNAAGIKLSTGTVGSSYDKTLAESINELNKTELIKPREPWKGLEDLTIATAEWVDRFNHRRPTAFDNITPAEAKATYHVHHQSPATAGDSS